MKRLRFSIGALMGLVLLVAVGFAALRSSTPIWASSIFTATFLCLTVGLLGAFARRGAWLGFAVFGWAYFLGVFWLWPGVNGVTAPPFVSKHLIDSLGPGTAGTSTMTIDPGPPGESAYESPPMYVQKNAYNVGVLVPFPGRLVNLLQYRRIGHSLTAILLGVVGAFLGRFIASREGSGIAARPDVPA